MIAATHTKHAPWAVVKANDKSRAHLALVRHILLNVDYQGRDLDAIGTIDEKILGFGPGRSTGRSRSALSLPPSGKRRLQSSRIAWDAA